MALFAVDLFTQADQVIPTGELYCAKERFRNDPTPNWFSRAWGLRNGIAGEIQLG